MQSIKRELVRAWSYILRILLVSGTYVRVRTFMIMMMMCLVCGEPHVGQHLEDHGGSQFVNGADPERHLSPL